MFRRAYQNETTFEIGSLAGAFFLLILIIASTSAATASASIDIQRPETSWFVDMNRVARSAHAALTCEQCHGTMTDSGKKHPDLKNVNALKREASRRYDYGSCKECHRVAVDRYQKGVHAKALTEELSGEARPDGEKPKKAPVCGDCHSVHYDPAGLSRVETGRRMVGICGVCHEAQVRGYLNDFHGRAAVDLGDERAAFCTDCHGAHTAVSLKEKEQALRACTRCHPKADARFTTFVIHPSIDTLAQKDPEKKAAVILVHRVKVIAAILLGALLFFFSGHTFLWFLRELHEKLRKK